MGRVEDLLAVNTAKVLALYPTDEPVHVTHTPGRKENQEMPKTNLNPNKTFTLSSLKTEQSNSKNVKIKSRKVKTEYKESVDFKLKKKVAIKAEFKRKRSATENQEKNLEYFKPKRIKKEIKNEYYEYENKESLNWGDVKKEAGLEAIKRQFDVNIPNDKSSIIKMINENAAKYSDKHSHESSLKDGSVDKTEKNKITQKHAFEQKKSSLNSHLVDCLKEDSHQAIVFRKRKSCNQRRFSVEEDEVIIKAMETLGDKISIMGLSKELDRDYSSIRDRIIKLKTGNGSRKVCRPFSLNEDLVIMDKALENCSGNPLAEMKEETSSELAHALARNRVAPRKRWGYQLKPWILQHYSGTLNLNIKRMLANFLAENFDNIESIDWLLVAKKPEFVGNTEGSLRNIFSGYLLQTTKRNLNLESHEITLTQIAEIANETFGEQSIMKISKKLLSRQKHVIDYFEQYVKKQGITNFL